MRSGQINITYNIMNHATKQLPTFSSSLPLLSFSPTIVQTAKADVNIDTSGNGKADCL